MPRISQVDLGATLDKACERAIRIEPAPRDAVVRHAEGLGPLRTPAGLTRCSERCARRQEAHRSSRPRQSCWPGLSIPLGAEQVPEGHTEPATRASVRGGAPCMCFCPSKRARVLPGGRRARTALDHPGSRDDHPELQRHLNELWGGESRFRSPEGRRAPPLALPVRQPDPSAVRQASGHSEGVIRRSEGATSVPAGSGGRTHTLRPHRPALGCLSEVEHL